MKARGLRTETIKTRRRHLNHFARSIRLDPNDITVDIMLGWAG